MFRFGLKAGTSGNPHRFGDACTAGRLSIGRALAWVSGWRMSGWHGRLQAVGSGRYRPPFVRTGRGTGRPIVVRGPDIGSDGVTDRRTGL